MQKLSKFVFKILKGNPKYFKLFLPQICLGWDSFIPENFNRKSLPISLWQGVLTVEIASELSLFFSYEVPSIISKINLFFGNKEVVKRIRIIHKTKQIMVKHGVYFNVDGLADQSIPRKLQAALLSFARTVNGEDF